MIQAVQICVVRRFIRLLESVVSALARFQNPALPQESVSFLGQSHDFHGIVLDVRDRFDFSQSLPLQIFDIVFHAVPVAVVREFRKVVLRYDAELSLPPKADESPNL